VPEILKNQKGEVDYQKIFLGLAASLVLILQQWQSYRIAEIKTQGEVNAVNFMSKDEIEKRLEKLEDEFMHRNEINIHIKRIDDRLDMMEKELLDEERDIGNVDRIHHDSISGAIDTNNKER